MQSIVLYMKMLSFVGQNWYTENSLVAGVVIAFKFY